jgi:carboxyl-terminal processing protease
MKRNLFLTFISLLLVFCAGLFSFGTFNRPVSAEAEAPYRELQLFTDVLSVIRQDYVEEVDMKELVYGGIKGMMAVLDPHSSFMPPDVYKEMQVETKGEFGGIGIEVSLRDGLLTVVAPIEDTPAFKAGIMAGDRIVLINGEETNDIGLMDAVKYLRGKPGTQIEIGVTRLDSPERIIFAIQREIIKIVSVKARTLEPGYALVRLVQFQERTDIDLKQALHKIHQQNSDGLKGLILDLRNNPGGLLDQAVKVSDVFLERGLIVYTEGRNEQSKMKFTAHQANTEADYPIVILINAGSASAAEIVAGALQDHRRAILLGTRSFGKGSVQTIMPLADNSGLRLTTAHYFTPSGRSIQAAGIKPDVHVRQTINAAENTEESIREQDLNNHFESDKSGKDESVKQTQGTNFSEQDLNDIQLMRALDLLKGWRIFNKLTPKAA